MSKTEQIMEEVQSTDTLHLQPEDIIHNLQISLQQLAKENAKLEEELRIARSDLIDMKEAVANYFVNRWRIGM